MGGVCRQTPGRLHRDKHEILPTLKTQRLALPWCRWETSARKLYGCVYSLHPGCHTFGHTRVRLPCIGFFITETPSTGVSPVAGWSRVPRRTTFPHLSGYTGCWLEVPSTTSLFHQHHQYCCVTHVHQPQNVHLLLYRPLRDKERH